MAINLLKTVNFRLYIKRFVPLFFRCFLKMLVSAYPVALCRFAFSAPWPPSRQSNIESRGCQFSHDQASVSSKQVWIILSISVFAFVIRLHAMNAGYMLRRQVAFAWDDVERCLRGNFSVCARNVWEGASWSFGRLSWFLLSPSPPVKTQLPQTHARPTSFQLGITGYECSSPSRLHWGVCNTAGYI